MISKKMAAVCCIALAGAATPALAQRQAPTRPQYVPLAGDYAPPARRPEIHDLLVERMKPAGETPRRADGHPDLSGLWTLGFPSPVAEGYGRRSNELNEADQAAMQRSSHFYKPIYKPEYWDKVRSLDFSVVDTDPVYNCAPDGVPRQGIPEKISLTDKEIWLYDGGDVRVVPFGRKLTEDDQDQATFRGVSSASWNGDVLEIDSVGFTGDTWLAWEGLFHTDRMKVKERLWREGNLLYYNFTVDDPIIFMRPWTSATQVKRLNASPTAYVEEPLPCLARSVDGFLDKYYRG